MQRQTIIIISSVARRVCVCAFEIAPHFVLSTEIVYECVCCHENEFIKMMAYRDVVWRMYCVQLTNLMCGLIIIIHITHTHTYHRSQCQFITLYYSSIHHRLDHAFRTMHIIVFVEKARTMWSSQHTTHIYGIRTSSN